MRIERREIASAEESFLEWIRKEQLPDGGFVSLSSVDTNFRKGKNMEQKTNFATALISWCLSGSEHSVAKRIRDLSASCLLSERSPNGSWNYWRKNTGNEILFPCPDDLDDTVSALIALTANHSDGMITGSDWSGIIQLLTASEIQPGGPYYTWLVGNNSDTDSENTSKTKWRDIDVAINASIAYFLGKNGIVLKQLWTFLENALLCGRVYSPYYIGELPVIFFLARASEFAPESHREIVRTLCVERLFKKDRMGYKNALEAAMMALSWIFVEKPWRAQPALGYILSNKEECIRAESFWIDPAIGGIRHYAGATAVTAAYCYCALNSYVRQMETSKKTITPIANPEEKAVMAGITEKIRNICGEIGPLREKIRDEFEKILNTATTSITGRSILMISYDFWRELPDERKKCVPLNILIDLGFANACGWVAYRILDDIADEGKNREVLWPALALMRKSYDAYRGVAPNKLWIEKIETIFSTMELALGWEEYVCRKRFVNNDGDSVNILIKMEMPDYGTYNVIAEKSIGHALGPLLVLGHCGAATEDAEVVALENMFKHYLIARQLHDDAHDWLDDLKRGQINLAGALTIKLAKTEKAVSEKISAGDLQKIFWERAIDEISRKILEHTDCARKKIPAGHSVLNHLLEPLEASARKSITERDSVLQFIRVYQSSVNN